MPLNEPATVVIRDQRLGRLLIVAGLLLWVFYSATRLPYASYKSIWMFSLEFDLFTPREWLHPLFVPLVALFQDGLELVGYRGRMLLPTEVLNLVAGLLTLVGLFALAERFSRDSLLAAAAVLPLAFEAVFWEFVLPADPYALGAACSFATIALLLSHRPRRPRWRYALAGVAVAGTIGFSAAGLMLFPVAAVAAWRDAGLGREALARLGSLVLAAGGALLLIFTAFMLFHGVGLDRLGPSLVKEVFLSGQEPGGTIYETGSVLRQVSGFLRSVNGTPLGFGLAEVMLLFIGVLLTLRWRRGELEADEKRIATVVLANVLIYSLFFIFNDNTNGFICAVVLPLPLLVARLGASGLWSRRVLLALSTLLLLLQIGRGGPYDHSRQEFAIREARFLDAAIDESGVLVLPGCPFLDVLYTRRFDVIRIWEVEEGRHPCIVPVTEPARLERRMRATLEAGRSLYFIGEPPESFTTLEEGALGSQQQMQHLLFAAPEIPPREVGDNLEALAHYLKARFETRCELLSPRGWRYCQVLSPKATGESDRAGGYGALRAISGLGSGAEQNDNPELRRRYLEQWLAAYPGDADVSADLRSQEE